MEVREAINKATALVRTEKWSAALEVLHPLLNEQIELPAVMFLAGTCEQQLGHDGLAYLLYTEAIRIKPDFTFPMINVCQILRQWGKHDEEAKIWEEIEKIASPGTRINHNRAGAFLDNGTPEIAEKYARADINQVGEKPDNMIQLGLSLLEQQRFGEGFDAWDRGLMLGERKLRNFQGLGQTPFWDGSPVDRLVVYGEQGHGDEIMFASCLRQAMARCGQVFIDTSKADLVPLYQRSFPETVVLCTPDSQFHDYHAELQINAAIPFGSLPTLFRREMEDFPDHDGYIQADTAKRREMRRRLDDLGDGLKIGIAWRGGLKQTHAANRNTDIEKWAPITRQSGAHFISVQYGPQAPEACLWQERHTGAVIHHWKGAVDNFDMLTALIDELDLVISVPQTAVHQRAALGKECWVLVPHKSPWPFAGASDACPWYPKQTRLFRQTKEEHGNWVPTILRVAHALSERTGSEPGAVCILEKAKPASELMESPQC